MNILSVLGYMAAFGVVVCIVWVLYILIRWYLEYLMDMF